MSAATTTSIGSEEDQYEQCDGHSADDEQRHCHLFRRLDRVLSIIPSLTTDNDSSIVTHAEAILRGFLCRRRWSPVSSTAAVAAAPTTIDLSQRAVNCASLLRQIAAANGNSLQARRELQQASLDILTKRTEIINENDTSTLLFHSNTASRFSLSLVVVALALSVTAENRTTSRSAASAICSSLQDDLAAEAESSHQLEKKYGRLLEELVHAVVRESATKTSSSQSVSAAAEVDLHILAAVARASGVIGCGTNETTAKALRQVIQSHLEGITGSDNDGSSILSLATDTSAAGKGAAAASAAGRKADVAAALSCAAQLGRPWRTLSPAKLIEFAVSYGLWHAAERICAAAAVVELSGGAGRNEKDDEVVVAAVAASRCLVDAAIEARMYRFADAFATRFLDTAGPSRYLDARYLHGCDTIVKVIRKRSLPVIERQVIRIDETVAEVSRIVAAASRGSRTCNDGGDSSRDCFTCAETASIDIRNFAIRQLEESGEIDTVLRLTTLWEMQYLHDEERLKAALDAKRRKYMQWDELFPDSPVPTLITSPEDLLSQFRELEQHGSVYGFDVEWADDVGAALLQMSTLQGVMLIDILALSKTPEGTAALASTVGCLFAGTTDVVVGFACRQDLSRLRSTPCCSRHKKNGDQQHWLKGTTAVLDLRDLLAPGQSSFGLSRCCFEYLGKPLDKAEQCSLWTRRPLSREQRIYAAMDAHVCALIYRKAVRREEEYVVARSRGGGKQAQKS